MLERKGHGAELVEVQGALVARSVQIDDLHDGLQGEDEAADGEHALELEGGHLPVLVNVRGEELLPLVRGRAGRAREHGAKGG